MNRTQMAYIAIAAGVLFVAVSGIGTVFNPKRPGYKTMDRQKAITWISSFFVLIAGLIGGFFYFLETKSLYGTPYGWTLAIVVGIIGLFGLVFCLLKMREAEGDVPRTPSREVPAAPVRMTKEQMKAELDQPFSQLIAEAFHAVGKFIEGRKK